MSYTLSSSHYSTEDQLRDVMNWLLCHNPALYCEIDSNWAWSDIKWDPILSGIDFDATREVNPGIDDEYPMHLIDHLESVVDGLYWDDGEPWFDDDSDDGSDDDY